MGKCQSHLVSVQAVTSLQLLEERLRSSELQTHMEGGSQSQGPESAIDACLIEVNNIPLRAHLLSVKSSMTVENMKSSSINRKRVRRDMLSA